MSFVFIVEFRFGLFPGVVYPSRENERLEKRQQIATACRWCGDAIGNLLLVLLGVAVGLAVGIGGFTFVYAKGASYLTDDPPGLCQLSCHGEQFAGWIRSSHRSVAVCNDCHTPKGMIAKYLNKSANGARHSWA